MELFVNKNELYETYFTNLANSEYDCYLYKIYDFSSLWKCIIWEN